MKIPAIDRNSFYPWMAESTNGMQQLATNGWKDTMEGPTMHGISSMSGRIHQWNATSVLAVLFGFDSIVKL